MTPKGHYMCKITDLVVYVAGGGECVCVHLAGGLQEGGNELFLL